MTLHDEITRMEKIAVALAIQCRDIDGELITATPPEFFYVHNHQILWREIQAREIMDLPELLMSLDKNLRDYYYNNILDADTTWCTLGSALAFIREKRRELDIRTAAEMIIQSPGAETYAGFQRAVETPAEKKGAKQILRDFITGVFARRAGEFSGVETGFPIWDDHTCGLVHGRLNILSARPKVGKTALALTWAWDIARRGGRVLYITTEMSANEILSRLCGSLMGVSSNRILKASNLTDDQCRELTDAVGRIAMSGFRLVEMIGAPWKNVVAEIFSADTDAVVIDQLQAMRFDTRRRVFDIGDATKEIRAVAAKKGCGLLLLCQLGRGADARESCRPMLSDLRDSGEIEQDADTVTFIYRPHRNSADRNLMLAANRHGPTCEIKLGFNPAKATFYEEGYAHG